MKDGNQAASSFALEFVRAQGQTHRGMKRAENQDSVLVLEASDLRLYAVADGMGGTKGGARASQLATLTLEEFVRQTPLWTEQTLIEAYHTAHDRIRDEALRNPELSQMGTTLVCLALHEKRLFVANVGDSRVYCIRNGKITRLTKDHTVVADLVRDGTLSPEQAMSTPISHMLTQSLGGNEKLEVDAWVGDAGVAPGDKFLLCSDGLYSQLSEQEIESICKSLPTNDAVEKLVRRANELGGADNISVILVDVCDEYSSEKSADEILALRRIEVALNSEIETPLGSDTVSAPAAQLPLEPSRISVGPVQALFFVCGAFLSGLFVGSEGLVVTTRAAAKAQAAKEEEVNQSRASFRSLNETTAKLPKKTFLQHATELARQQPALRGNLARYQKAHSAYLSQAEDLLMSPPDLEKEKHVVDLLNDYERSLAELEAAVFAASQIKK